MAYNGAQWDEANPTNSTLANEIDDIARDIKIGVRSRMQNEHIWPAVQSATLEGGLHKYITFSVQTAPPDLVVGTATQAGALYVTSGNALIFTNSASQAVTVVAAGGYSALPPGSMMPFGGTAAPVGYYICNGTAVSRSTDAALYGVLGTRYGTGDGSTTFNVPDLRGYTIVGKSDAGMFATVGATTGALTVALTSDELAAHTHFIARDVDSASTLTLANALARGHVVASDESYDLKGAGTPADVGLSSPTGSGTAHANVQPSMVFNYIIAR